MSGVSIVLVLQSSINIFGLYLTSSLSENIRYNAQNTIFSKLLFCVMMQHLSSKRSITAAGSWRKHPATCGWSEIVFQGLYKVVDFSLKHKAMSSGHCPPSIANIRLGLWLLGLCRVAPRSRDSVLEGLRVWHTPWRALSESLCPRRQSWKSQVC